MRPAGGRTPDVKSEKKRWRRPVFPGARRTSGMRCNKPPGNAGIARWHARDGIQRRGPRKAGLRRLRRWVRRRVFAEGERERPAFARGRRFWRAARIRPVRWLRSKTRLRGVSALLTPDTSWGRDRRQIVGRPSPAPVAFAACITVGRQGMPALRGGMPATVFNVVDRAKPAYDPSTGGIFAVLRGSAPLREPPFINAG